MQESFNENVYSEVYSCLLELGEDYINKIPYKFFQHIKDKRNPNFNPKFNFEKNLENQISDDAINFIAYINMQYWSNDTEKEDLIECYKKNDIIYEEKWQYQMNNMFQKKRSTVNNTSEEKSLVKHKENIFKRFINKFFSMLKKH